MRTGRPKNPITWQEKFWTFVQKTETCWLWIGTRNKKGYGIQSFSYASPQMAHRLSWKIHRGKITKGMGVLHRCDNPACVNPEHLFLGTNGTNNRDRHSKGRDAKGSRNGATKLTAEAVREIRRLTANGYGHRKPVLVKDLGKKYGVSYQAIVRVVKNEVWTHV